MGGMIDTADMTSLGWCADFPPVWADLMWGLDDGESSTASDRKVMVSAGIRICEKCPVRVECLADAIVRREQVGIRGGLPLRARRRLRSMAVIGGVDMSGDESKALHGLTRWLKTHQELIEAARDAETADRQAKRRRQLGRERSAAGRVGRGGFRRTASPGPDQGVLDL
ncbi:WhiB family transcriptional regulator [Bifidobacterium sp.]|uniref:WhiB family transcriptional regulator n=1 Tax=Bifidobacterium sp. TaxID=41200 RepID=UPI00258031BF|nr:WhiB family transcriptional regulator [Bifidobacterium sp.]